MDYFQFLAIIKKKISGEFPGYLAVRILGFHCYGLGLISGQETEIPQAAWHSLKEKFLCTFLHMSSLFFCICLFNINTHLCWGYIYE